MKSYRSLAIGALGMLAFHHALAQQTPPSQLPLLIIGASYANASTPYNNGTAPLGGVSVNLGSYLSLGNALAANHRLPGYVINEAQAGATTFARLSCSPATGTCGPAAWDSYQTQLERAISRVAIPPTFSQLNAKYVVIVKGNDCLHADAFGIPQSQSQPCTLNDMNATIDRQIAVGQYALDHGLTPIFDIMPRYEDLDLPLFRARANLQWVISEADYNMFRDQNRMRIAQELPRSIVLDMWKDFVHAADGLHPNDATNRGAAEIIAKALQKREH